VTRVVASVIVLLAAVGAAQAAPPHQQTTSSIDVWGAPSRSAEIPVRPLGGDLRLFRSTASVASLPAGKPMPMEPLAVVAAQLLGHPGKLLPAETRRVVTGAGSIYLVPTDRGWICVQAQEFETCHRGLLRQGVTWSFYSTDDRIAVVGIAADRVAGVTLAFGTERRVATLRDNVFYVARQIRLTSTDIPPLGTLVISYRNNAPAASVAVDG
jgi:hypothetical protein